MHVNKNISGVSNVLAGQRRRTVTKILLELVIREKRNLLTHEYKGLKIALPPLFHFLALLVMVLSGQATPKVKYLIT